jgi:NADH-quinone oxidoreductase subunit H
VIPSSAVFHLLNSAAVAFLAWMVPLQMVPLFIWLERKGSAIIQDRIGPNRASILGFKLFGMLHNLADVVKLVMKEDLVPARAERFFYFLAPAISMSVALLPLAVVPFASALPWGAETVRFEVLGGELGLLMLLAATSLGVFGLILAGWSSNNKFALLGSLRSSSQMISYELSVSLAVVAVLMAFGTADLTRIVESQGGPLVLSGRTWPLPAWGVFLQPVGFLLFLVGAFAETNRNPFDLPEGESELGAGYHVEYSSMKFALFFMAEYSNMTVASLVIATLFLGGYQVPFVSAEALRAHPREVLHVFCLLAALTGASLGPLFVMMQRRRPWAKGFGRVELYVYAAGAFGLALLALAAWPLVATFTIPAWLPGPLAAFTQFNCLMVKALFFCWLFVWVRWTLPRFRYDQLMALGWKVLLPIALANVAVTGVFVLWK